MKGSRPERYDWSTATKGEHSSLDQALPTPDQWQDREIPPHPAEGWAFEKFYNSESARLAALPSWVHEYNHHRPHSAVDRRRAQVIARASSGNDATERSGAVKYAG